MPTAAPSPHRLWITVLMVFLLMGLFVLYLQAARQKTLYQVKASTFVETSVFDREGVE